MQKVERGRSGNQVGGRLWIPARIVELIPPESRFEAELTEEGILFRRVTGPRLIANPPSWATGR